jgi:hypothetical protein
MAALDQFVAPVHQRQDLDRFRFRINNPILPYPVLLTFGGWRSSEIGDWRSGNA